MNPFDGIKRAWEAAQAFIKQQQELQDQLAANKEAAEKARQAVTGATPVAVRDSLTAARPSTAPITGQSAQVPVAGSVRERTETRIRGANEEVSATGQLSDASKAELLSEAAKEIKHSADPVAAFKDTINPLIAYAKQIGRPDLEAEAMQTLGNATMVASSLKLQAANPRPLADNIPLDKLVSKLAPSGHVDGNGLTGFATVVSNQAADPSVNPDELQADVTEQIDWMEKVELLTPDLAAAGRTNLPAVIAAGVGNR